jgi:hypothetical protein
LPIESFAGFLGVGNVLETQLATAPLMRLGILEVNEIGPLYEKIA